jgi:hypothetical protein
MSRERKDDFRKLEDFLKNYAITGHSNDPEFKRLLKQLHGKLISFLTFVIEIELRNPEVHSYSDKSISYAFECASDLAQALFCWIHGAYKPANLVLRSSIETFVKAVCGTENPKIFDERSVYQVMNDARASKACGAQPVTQYFSRIHSEYTALCGVAHSASADRQLQVQALRMFPKFDAQNAEEFGGRLIALADSYLAILISNNEIAFRNAHYKNRIIVLDSLPNEIKKELFIEPQR